MSTKTEASKASGFSFGKIVFWVVAMGLLAVVVVYGRTIALFTKFFVQELKAEFKKK
jgi:hypothetical protein